MKAATTTSAYCLLYPRLAEVARQNGYALALHGTLARDMDLLAAPWTDGAVDAFTLVKALKEAAGGCWWNWEEQLEAYYPDGQPTRKPHGRIAWSVHLTNRGGEGPYLDISVMPRSSDWLRASVTEVRPASEQWEGFDPVI